MLTLLLISAELGGFQTKALGGRQYVEVPWNVLLRLRVSIGDRLRLRMPNFLDCRTYREKAGLSVAALSRTAGVDRGTIGRIEQGGESRPDIVMRLVNGINKARSDAGQEQLDPDQVITDT